MELNAPQSFEIKFSNLFNTIQGLNRDKKYIIYGYGNVAKMIDKILENSIIGFVDKNSNIINQEIKRETVYSPNNLSNMQFDYIIISVIGRENEILKLLKSFLHIAENKIICL